MYLSTSDGADGADIDDNSQTRQGNTSPVPSAVCKIYLNFLSFYFYI
jgi:hypothetical protein